MDSSSSIDPSLLLDISPDLGSLSGFDDSLTFTDFPELEEDALFAAAWDEQEPPQGEGAGLSSTSPHWDFVQPKVERISPPPVIYTNTHMLTPAQEERLRNIAMPQRLDYRSKNRRTPDARTRKSNSVSSPDDNSQSRKRKPSADADDEDDEDASGQHPVKKTAHNMIEQRYRTNLSDKIAALRDSVPSLRIMTKSARGEDTADDIEELQGLAPAHKLNKATVGCSSDIVGLILLLLKCRQVDIHSPANPSSPCVV